MLFDYYNDNNDNDNHNRNYNDKKKLRHIIGGYGAGGYAKIKNK